MESYDNAITSPDIQYTANAGFPSEGDPDAVAANVPNSSPLEAINAEIKSDISEVPAALKENSVTTPDEDMETNESNSNEIQNVPVEPEENLPTIKSAENDNSINELAADAEEKPVEAETSEIQEDAPNDESIKEDAPGSPAATVQKAKKEEEIDPNQCRICLAKKDLIDIFMIEEHLSFSDKIVVVCPAIKILKNDYLPHFICSLCLTNLKISYNFKLLCEQTDKELRKKLKRSKNKVRRRPTEFVLIDAGALSESDSDDGKKADDDEFHLSGSLSEADDTSDSSYSATKYKKKRPSRQRKRASTSRAGRKKSNNTSTSKNNKSNAAAVRTSTRAVNKRKGATSKSAPPPAKVKAEVNKRPRREIVLIKATEESDDDDDEDDVPLKQRIRNVDILSITGAPRKPSESVKPHKCPFCDKAFNSPQVLKDHKKTHSNDKPPPCKSCGKMFKNRSAGTQHMNKHKDPVTGDLRCERRKPENKAKLPLSVAEIKKKKPDFELPNVGRDLFKCVAPLKTTYWSDSFSD